MRQACVEDHLRAAEDGELLAGLVVGDGRVPHLCRPPAVYKRGFAFDDALVLGAEEIALEFDGGETLRFVGQIDEAAVSAGGVSERNYRGRVQVTVRCE